MFRTCGLTLSPTRVSNQVRTLSAPCHPGSFNSPSIEIAPVALRMVMGGPGVGAAACAARAPQGVKRTATSAHGNRLPRLDERAMDPDDMCPPRAHEWERNAVRTAVGEGAPRSKPVQTSEADE